MIALLAALASAAPLIAEPTTTTSSGWGVRLSAAGAYDRWEADALPLGEVRLAAAWGHDAALSWRTSYAGSAHAWPSLVRDSHVAEVRVTQRRRVAFGVGAATQGATTSGWLGADALAVVAWEPSVSFRGELAAGPGVRADDTVFGEGASVEARSRWRAGPRMSFDARARYRGWLGDDLVDHVSASLSTTLGPRPMVAWEIGAGVDATTAGPEVSAAGLPPADVLWVRARTAAEVALTRNVAARVQVAYERAAGPVEFERATAAAGLTVRLGGWSARPEHDRGPLEFRLRAPDAKEVAVVGSFSHWRPVPMILEGDGTWRVALEVEPGVHEYVYIVDGRPLTPPESTALRADDMGFSNGVLIVP